MLHSVKVNIPPELQQYKHVIQSENMYLKKKREVKQVQKLLEVKKTKM